MAVGRAVCVALPLVLIVASIIATLAAVLSGVTHHQLKLFTLDLKDLNISQNELADFADDFGIDLGTDELKNKIDDFADDAADQISDKANDAGNDLGISKRDIDIKASTLGLSDTYEVSLWGYCAKNETGKRHCSDHKFNWANDVLDPAKIEKSGHMAELGIKLPDEIKDALNVFRKIIKWAEVAFIIALLALGVEFVVGIFSNFSRGVSCLTWLLASIAAALVCCAAALATATSAVVVGTIDGSNELFGAKGTIDTKFLAAVWIGAAFAIGAAFFWIFTICCCKPEHRSKRSNRHSDGEKLLGGGGFASRGYAPLSHEHEMTGSAYNSHTPSLPQFHEPHADHHAAPQYPSGTATRSDLAYEPYSHRA